jgi:PPM family protein phosphatase
MTAPVSLLAAAASEVGSVRQDNEDSVYSGRWLHAVADGLGGHADGELASAAVIGILAAHDAETEPGSLLEVLGRAVAEANAEVARRVAEDPARTGIGGRPSKPRRGNGLVRTLRAARIIQRKNND